MRNKTLWIIVMFLVALVLAPTAAAQSSVEETLDAYYEALTESLDTGDPAAWLEFFAEDAVMEVPALAPQPVTGKDLIEAAMWPGVFANVGGSVVEETLREVDGNTASVYAMWLGGTGGDMPIQEIFEFNDDGLIQSYTVNVGATPEGEAEAPAEEETATEEEPATLPESGGVLVNLLPGLLILGGAAMVGLGKRFSR